MIFWHALFRAHGGKFLAAALLKVAHDILQFMGPMILKYIKISYFISNIHIYFVLDKF